MELKFEAGTLIQTRSLYCGKNLIQSAQGTKTFKNKECPKSLDILLFSWCFRKHF